MIASSSAIHSGSTSNSLWKFSVEESDVLTDYMSLDGLNQRINLLKDVQASGDITVGGTTIAQSGSATLAGRLTISGGSFGALSNGEGRAYGSSTGGLIVYGEGTTNDFTVLNKSGANVITVPTGTQNVEFSGDIDPDVDNANDVGNASFRWREIFAANGTINTSDETLKTPFSQLTVTEREAFLAVKDIIGKYKWLDAIDAKGDAARIHIGVGAQSAITEFTNRGLDWTQYSCFCMDEIEVYETQTVTEQQPVFETLTREKVTIDIVDGKAVRTVTTEEYESPVYDEYPLFDDVGNPVMEDVVTGQDEDGNDIVEQQQVIHKVQRTESVQIEKEVLVPAGERYGVRYNELIMGILASI